MKKEMPMNVISKSVICAAMLAMPPAMIGATEPDPAGILRKPIPDKLVVLTFDDGCASHAATVAPILKSLGFGGTFYICEGFSFNTRKDWYLTWRQIKALAADGFEVGNHTYGHCGGAGIENWLSMEDRFLAHDCPKPTTVCWPVYHVNTRAYPDLAANGYNFGRGGHNRPYRPTVDNPLDVPSFTISDVLPAEKFVHQARQATGGKIVVFCYHGVPDMEHPGVGLAPAVFKAQMQYLKDNNYKVIALRDLTEHIDPAKAAKLPPTPKEIKEPGPVMLAKEAKPYVAVAVTETQADGRLTQKTPSIPAPQTAPVTYGPKDRVLRFDKPGDHTVGEPTRLASDLAVDVAGNGEVKMPGLISGPGRLIKNGKGRLTISNPANTYSGGTVINDGTVMMFVLAREGLGSGPITLNDGTLALELIHGTNPLVLNGGKIHAGNSVDSWNAPITLNGNTIFSIFGGFDLNKTSGGISGPGSLTIVGGGTADLNGINTYTGPTTVRQGRLIASKAASLYNADPARWTPAKITVLNTAELRLCVGGRDEFTCAQAGALLKNLTRGVENGGLMPGSIFGLDTSNATDVQEFSVDIADTGSAGGGSFTIRKCGVGTLRFSGRNTYTGRTVLEGGALSVSSLNRVVGGTSSSSLGAPTTLENGMIDFGGDCTLIYTGEGEVTDRIIDLTGDKQTATFDQSGRGLLKFTSPFDISGYGHSKTIVLMGSTIGKGELSGNIRNPYDRRKAAVTALTKTGTGTWILSGTNSFTGPTAVTQGTLALVNANSLGAGTEVSIADGAALELRSTGGMQVTHLALGGKPQPAGKYGEANTPGYFKGPGVLIVKQANE